MRKKLGLNISLPFKMLALLLCIGILMVPFTEAASRSPQDIESTAEQLIMHLRLERAKKLLEKITGNSQSTYLASEMLGIACNKLDEYQQAVDAFEKAKKFPFKPTAYISTEEELYLACGNCYYRLGQYRKAADNLKMAGQQGSGLLSCAQYKLGESKNFWLSDKMSFDEAEKYLLQQQSPTITINLEEPNLSEQFPGKGSRKAWEESLALVKEGERLEDCGKFKDAQTQYEKAIATYPYDGNAYAKLSLCKLTLLPMESGEPNFSEVLEFLSKAAYLDGSNWKIWNDLALIQLMQSPQQLTEARQSLKMALSCNPPDKVKATIHHTVKMNARIDELKEQMKQLSQTGDFKIIPHPNETPNGYFISPVPIK